MEIEIKSVETETESFDEFEISTINQAKSIILDYSYFDNIRKIKEAISKHNEDKVFNEDNRNYKEVTKLQHLDEVSLNPLSVILDSRESLLYEHPFIKEYIIMKFRQRYFLILIILDIFLYCCFLVRKGLLNFMYMQLYYRFTVYINCVK